VEVASAQRIETEHVEVRRLAERLTRASSPFVLRRDVRALLASLPAHFHYEEREDGPFALAVARLPDEAWRFDEVRDKHARMLETLEDLFNLVERDDSYDAARFLALELGAQLLAHDQMEAEWLRTALVPKPWV
jgi:hypothetical protein